MRAIVPDPHLFKGQVNRGHVHAPHLVDFNPLKILNKASDNALACINTALENTHVRPHYA
jgi:hypothetical protein